MLTLWNLVFHVIVSVTYVPQQVCGHMHFMFRPRETSPSVHHFQTKRDFATATSPMTQAASTQCYPRVTIQMTDQHEYSRPRV
jgi:hypothetical protein